MNTTGQVSTISGGITNCLVKVTPAPVTGLDPVVVRIFGRNTDMIIDREEELRRLLELNKMGFGAKVGETLRRVPRVWELQHIFALCGADDSAPPTIKSC